MEYLNRFHQMFEEMGKDPSISFEYKRDRIEEIIQAAVKTGQLLEGKSNATLGEAGMNVVNDMYDYECGLTLKNQRRYKFPFPEHLISFQSISNGTSARWWYANNEEEFSGGEFNLVSLISAWINSGKTGISKEYVQPEYVSLLKSLSIIDQHPYSGDNLFTVICVDGGKELYFHDRGLLFKMTLNYEEYLNCLLELRGGYNGWQFLFCEGSLENANHCGERFLKDMTTYLHHSTRLFPDTDFQKYQDRLFELRKKLID